jgi:DNA helicase MCM9
MFREEVTVMDAAVVVTLMESSMQSAALISADNCLHSSFPSDAMMEYQRQSKQWRIKIKKKKFIFIVYFFLVDLVLKRLGLEELLNSEMKRMEEIAALQIENCDADPFEFRKDLVCSETHIAQTQAILANIHIQNQEKSDLFVNEENECGVKRKQFDDGQSQPSKKIRFSKEKICSSSRSKEKTFDCTAASTTEYDNGSLLKAVNVNEKDTEMLTNVCPEMSTSFPDPKNDSCEEIPSIIGSPIISSTFKENTNSSANTKSSIFKYGSDDDTIFDL